MVCAGAAEHAGLWQLLESGNGGTAAQEFGGPRGPRSLSLAGGGEHWGGSTHVLLPVEPFFA